MGKLTPGVNWHVRQDRKYLDPTPLEELKTKNHEYIRGKIEMNKIDDRWEFILDEIIGEVKMGRMNGPFAAPDWWPTLTAAPRHEGVNKLLPLPHDDPFIAMAVSIEQAGSDGNAKIRRGEDWTQLHLHHARPALPPYLGPLRFPWLGLPGTR